MPKDPRLTQAVKVGEQILVSELRLGPIGRQALEICAVVCNMAHRA